VDSFWDFFWFTISFFLLFAYLMVLFQIVSDLFRDHTVSGWVKAVWILCLIFFPFITMVVYLIARGQGMAERNMAAAQGIKAQQDEYIRSVASGGPSASDEIARAKSLLDSGAITQEEFDALKAKALA
jgi:hypothetical protein